MTCENLEQLIALEVAGDLPANEASRVQAHLKDCAACRNLAEELAADREWLQAEHRQPPDPAALHQVRVGVMRQLEAEQGRGNRPFGGLAVVGCRWVIAAAAVAIVLGAAAWWNSPPNAPASVALDSIEHNDQDPGIEQRRASREAQPDIAQFQAPTEANESHAHASKPRIAIPAASGATNPRESRGETTSAPEPSMPSRREEESKLQLAQLDPTEGATTAANQPRVKKLESGAQMKIVTTVLNEPEEPPTETVMLKIPSSNPNIVVYWLMDEEKQPQADELNQGD